MSIAKNSFLIDHRVINYYSIPPETDGLDVSLFEMSNGLYFFTLVLDGKNTTSRKIIVAK